MDSTNNNNEIKALTLSSPLDNTKYTIQAPDVTIAISVIFAMFVGLINYLNTQYKNKKEKTLFGAFIATSISAITAIIVGNLCVLMGITSLNAILIFSGIAATLGDKLIVLLGTVFYDFLAEKFKAVLETLFGGNKKD